MIIEHIQVLDKIKLNYFQRRKYDMDSNDTGRGSRIRT